LFDDSAIRYVLLYRVWGIVSGLISILIIANYLPAAIQGYYYTFLSIVALQAFLELGLYFVIMNTASHEWSGLSLNSDRNIQGNAKNLSRLVSLGRMVLKWYGIISLLFILIVGLIGVLFFPESEKGIWLMPWLLLIVLSGFNLFALPMISLLEGCGQIREINKFRLIQAFISSLVLWYSIYLGAGLWAMVFVAFIIVLRDIYLLLIYYKPFFKPFWGRPALETINWKNEILPMQWRLGLQGMAGYFLLQLSTPVVFHYHGSIEAGKIGMSMQVVFAIQALGQVWLSTKTPLFGALVAREDFTTLNKIWKRALLVSLSIVFIVGFGLVGAVAIGQAIELQIMERVVGEWQFALLILAQFFSQFVQVEASYLRAFKKEYFTVPGVFGGMIGGALIWYFGSSMGVIGAIIGYTISMTIVLIWSSKIFISKRHVSLFKDLRRFNH